MAPERQTGGTGPRSVRKGPTMALAAAREHQAATAEILGLIASSPDDAQPVFDAVARHTLRLCGGRSALVLRYDGARLHLVAHENVSPEGLDRVVASFPRPPDRTFPMGVAVLDRMIVHDADLQASGRFRGMVAYSSAIGSVIAVPLLRDGQPIGVIGSTHGAAGGFSDDSIALLQTFAAQ